MRVDITCKGAGPHLTAGGTDLELLAFDIERATWPMQATIRCRSGQHVSALFHS